MLNIDYGMISMPKGDSDSFTVTIANADGTAYVPATGESILFEVKKAADDTVAVISKDVTSTISAGVATVELTTTDTDIEAGVYVYGFAIKGPSTKNTFVVTGDFRVMQGVI